jgi:protein tyrosine/serine phosphatase
MKLRTTGIFSSLALLATIVGGCGSVPGKASPDDPAGNFYKVSDTVYRGGRPDGAGVFRLKELGVKTIIDLENDDNAVAQEKEWAANAGLFFIHEPMNGMESPRDNEVDDILSKIGDPALTPVYVHCMEGVDRTGLIIALYRVIDEGWSPKDAHDEMMAHGFKSILIAMNHYFEEKTNWDD